MQIPLTAARENRASCLASPETGSRHMALSSCAALSLLFPRWRAAIISLQPHLVLVALKHDLSARGLFRRNHTASDKRLSGPDA